MRQAKPKPLVQVIIMAPTDCGPTRKNHGHIKKEALGQSVFNELSTKNVPHILENIFLYLDYESYKNCLRVSISWNKLLSQASFRKKAKLVLKEGIQKDRKKLWYASKQGNVEEVKDILSSALVGTHYKMYGSTPLNQAAYKGHKDVVKMFLERGADIHKTDGFGMTPLHSAAEGGHRNIAQLLLDKEMGLNVAGELGQTPLHVAANRGHINVVKMLLDRGADPNKQEEERETPLHAAVSWGFTEVVKLLLDSGANHNTRDTFGETALHYAAALGTKKSVKLLLKGGADPKKVNYDGYTPLQMAMRSSHRAVVHLLHDRGAI